MRAGGLASRVAAARLHRDPALVCLDDALDQSQPDTGALALRVQAVEETEDPPVIARLDADPVVAHITLDAAIGA